MGGTMFLYWDGYEIDGSDTDFSIVLPEQVQLIELIEAFLQNPLLDARQKPEISCVNGNKNIQISLDSLKQMIQTGSYSWIEIQVNCKHPEELEEPLLQEIYSLSQHREPKEEAYGKVEHPCTPPVKQTYYTRGELTVTLCIGHNQVDKNEELEGYITNQALIETSKEALPYIELNVGPSFYYEYAIYLIDSLRSQFPSIATFGGLDCMGGWTGGCTYADSLYGYEKLEYPVPYHVKHSLKQLCAYDILCPGIWYYKKKWLLQRVSGFLLSKEVPPYLGAKERKNLKPISIEEYSEHVEKLLISAKSNFELICESAINIIFPEPSNYAVCGDVVNKLEQRITECGEHRDFMGYFCFSKQAGELKMQFRIPYEIKPYFCELMELMQTGALEEMKSETYRRRHED